MNYYNRHVGDYLKDTSHLTLLEHGIYTRLMDIYYVRELSIPKDQAARLIGAHTKEEIKALNSVLSEFFELITGSWVQHRCEREIEAFRDKSIKSKRSAKVMWENKKQDSERNANAMRTHSEGNANAMQRARIPITNNQYPIPNKKNTSAVAPPDGVTESVWTDFCQHRKEKKAKLTQTALDGIQREAVKAGWSLESALRECCARGWTGFKADWVADKPRAGPTAPASYKAIDDAKGIARWEEMTGRIHPDNPKNKTVIDITPRMELSA